MKQLLMWATALVAIGLLIVVSGVVPIGASGGHWAITNWFLDFVKRRSVATHAWGIDAPPLDNPTLVARGAALYDTGCRLCHGGADADLPKMMAGMTPHPPALSLVVRRWAPEELFWIVKYGIKFTGMPAWPAQQRDDEVWAIVAFLLELPDLDAQQYRQLVFGDAGPAAMSPGVPQAVRDVCWRCHGVDGKGRGHAAFPSLAGQRPAYLHGSLEAFVDGTRFSGIMGPVAQTLNDDAMREVSQYYGNLEPRNLEPRNLGTPERRNLGTSAARGETIAARGDPEHDLPSCADCHGPAAAPRNPSYPRLAGQYAEYLTLQLELFKQGRRGGSPYANIMHTFVGRLSAEQIADVAAYYSSLP